MPRRPRARSGRSRNSCPSPPLGRSRPPIARTRTSDASRESRTAASRSATAGRLAARASTRLARCSRSVVSSGIVAPVAGSTSLAQAVGDAAECISGGANHLSGGRDGGIGGADRPTDLFGKGGCRFVAQIINRIKRGAKFMLCRERAESIGEALHVERCKPYQQVHQQKAQREKERRGSGWAS